MSGWIKNKNNKPVEFAQKTYLALLISPHISYDAKSVYIEMESDLFLTAAEWKKYHYHTVVSLKVWGTSQANKHTYWFIFKC